MGAFAEEFVGEEVVAWLVLVGVLFGEVCVCVTERERETYRLGRARSTARLRNRLHVGLKESAR